MRNVRRRMHNAASRSMIARRRCLRYRALKSPGVGMSARRWPSCNRNRRRKTTGFVGRLCTASKAVAPPLRGPDHPPRWQNVINAQRCRRRRHKPAEDGRTVTSCLIGAAEGRDFLMHARDRRMKVLNRRDATIKWLQGSGCSVKEPVFLLVFQR